VAKVDQRRFDNQRPEFLEAAAAAALLGVQARTLYAYASRGLVTRVRVGQRSRYARADLERLKARHDARAGHGPVAGAALHWGEPVLATHISDVTPEGPRYRGQLATDLARAGTPFPQVCRLLWGADVALAAPPAPSARKSEQSRADAVVRFMTVTLAGLARSAAPKGLGPALEHARAYQLVLAFASAAGGSGRRASGDPASRFLASFGLAATPMRRRLIDAALVLCADHELNASTFAARVAASTGADLQACVLAALATFSGPRHGAASQEVEELLEQLTRPKQAAAIVRARTQRGQGMPGFGHPLYPQGDPRATVLLRLVRAAHRGPRVRRLQALIDVTRRLRGEHPNIDAALIAVTSAVGLPSGAGTALFAVGRTAGWIAHVLEQRQQPGILRPRARYLGPTPPPAG
jgi:citrate synthase